MQLKTTAKHKIQTDRTKEKKINLQSLMKKLTVTTVVTDRLTR